MKPKNPNRPNRPIYVSSIDEDKFERIQDFVLTPLAYVFLFLAMGIFGSLILLAICFL